MLMEQHPKSATVWMRWIKSCVLFLRKISASPRLFRPFWAMQKGQVKDDAKRTIRIKQLLDTIFPRYTHKNHSKRRLEL